MLDVDTEDTLRQKRQMLIDAMSDDPLDDNPYVGPNNDAGHIQVHLAEECLRVTEYLYDR